MYAALRLQDIYIVFGQIHSSPQMSRDQALNAGLYLRKVHIPSMACCEVRTSYDMTLLVLILGDVDDPRQSS